MNSQNISKLETRVTTFVKPSGDTIVEFKIKDARIILKDILDKQVLDSLVKVYIFTDKVKSSTIILQGDVIKKLEEKGKNDELTIANLNKIEFNKDTEIKLLNSTITQQKKEIRKQKTLKTIAYITAIVLPISLIVLVN